MRYKLNFRRINIKYLFLGCRYCLRGPDSLWWLQWWLSSCLENFSLPTLRCFTNSWDTYILCVSYLIFTSRLPASCQHKCCFLPVGYHKPMENNHRKYSEFAFEAKIIGLGNEQNGRHFADDILNCIFLAEQFCSLIMISADIVHNWQQVSICLSNGLVPSRNKSLPAPMRDALWRH